MKMQNKKTFLLNGLLLMTFVLNAATFHSAKSGNWNSPTTWTESGKPGASDHVIIQAGHIVTLNGSTYTHTGNITILDTGELIAKTGNSTNGFVFDGDEFHVFGKLTIPFPDKDFTITGNSFFWGHPSAVIFVSDDWIVSGNSQTIIDGICVEVDDDFHIESSNATICGGGGVSIGNNNSKNTFNLRNGATTNQICLNTKIYRGLGGNCNTLVASGNGNNEPIAIDDQTSTAINTPIRIDVLNMGAPDIDPDIGQELKIISLGNNPTIDNGFTSEGGTININDNGTTNDPSDDFVEYYPPIDYSGFDFFTYVISDQNGAYSIAEVTIEINSPLPVNLVRFSGQSNECNVVLNWATESEQDNAFFEIEKSIDGVNFKSIGKEDGYGTTTNFKEYSFTDLGSNGVNYYRLKQFDFNGQFTYSAIIFIETNCNRLEDIGIVTLFPNPVIEGIVQLRFDASDVEESNLFISNLSGQIIRDQNITIEKGNNHFVLEVDDLPAGTYFMRFKSQTTKFVKI